jgi:hypothetical protein
MEKRVKEQYGEERRKTRGNDKTIMQASYLKNWNATAVQTALQSLVNKGLQNISIT